MLQHHPRKASVRPLCRQRPAQDRGDFSQRRGRGQPDLRRGLADAGLQPTLGHRHEPDHPLVGFPRRVAPGEDAVLEQDRALRLRIGLEHLRHLMGQGEAGHDVGGHRQAVAVEVAAQGLAAGLIGEGQDGVGVGVVDVARRDPGVQQRLHRRVGRVGHHQGGALGLHHALVRQGVELAQGEQSLHAHGGQALRLDVAQVPARALDAQHLDRASDHVVDRGLQRGVAPAVLHQARIGAQQAAGIDAQGQVFAHAARGIAGHIGERVFVRPQTLHQAAFCSG